MSAGVFYLDKGGGVKYKLLCIGIEEDGVEET